MKKFEVIATDEGKKVSWRWKKLLEIGDADISAPPKFKEWIIPGKSLRLPSDKFTTEVPWSTYSASSSSFHSVSPCLGFSPGGSGNEGTV